jgi:hypothetical protein
VTAATDPAARQTHADTEIVQRAIEGHIITAPQHGAVIDQQTVTEMNGSTALTYEKGRRLCEVHGWIEYSGIISSIGWHMEHDDCGNS